MRLDAKRVERSAEGYWYSSLGAILALMRAKKSDGLETRTWHWSVASEYP